MALFFTIRDKQELDLSQILRSSFIQTYYGAEELLKWDNDLTPTKTEEFVDELVDDSDDDLGYSEVMAWRKILNPLKFIEFVVCFAMIGLDQALLLLSMQCERLWDKCFPSNSTNEKNEAASKPASKKKNLGLLNIGVWFRGLAYIVMSLVYGVVKCITSPWNWVVRPIVNYCQENWQEGGMSRAKPIIMLAAGVVLAAVVVLSLLAMAGIALGPLAPLALIPAIPLIAQLALPWIITLAAASGIASMVVAHRVATVIPEAFQDAIDAIFSDDVRGFDNKDFAFFRARYTWSDDIKEYVETGSYGDSNASSYKYFNATLKVPPLKPAPRFPAMFGEIEKDCPGGSNVDYPSQGGRTGPGLYATNPGNVTGATAENTSNPTASPVPATSSYGKTSNPNASK